MSYTLAPVSGTISTYVIKLDADANCPNDSTSLLILTTTVGTVLVHTYPDNATLPDNDMRQYDGEQPYYDLFYHQRRLPMLIDVLRNEKPVSFFFNPESKFACIHTGEEPVGEEEGRYRLPA